MSLLSGCVMVRGVSTDDNRQDGPEQFEFVMAIDEYKRANKRPFPSWTEVLEVIKYLGYRKVADKAEHVDRPAPDPE